MTDTTREEFEKAWEKTYGYIPPLAQLYPEYIGTDVQKAWEAYQAAKADELAFLENLVEHVDSFIWKRIDDRIAELKGEK